VGTCTEPPVTREDVLRAFATRVAHPVSAREFLQLLKVPRDERVGVRRQLRALAATGALVLVRGHRYGLPQQTDLVVGRLVMHPDGYGFVKPDDPLPDEAGDIYVAPLNLKESLHGDRVVVRLEPGRRERRQEGCVTQILERTSQRVVGRFEETARGLGYVVPHERRLVVNIDVPAGETRDARPGDMVVAEITRWPTATRGPLGRVVEVLGSLDEPGVDTLVIIRKHGIPDDHGAEALAEAARLGTEVREADLTGRTDYRAWPIVTIDGEDARDFDDAISVEILPNGHFWIGVHIADVSHYVRPGGVIDAEALDRGTSVYFPDRAVHMLPTALASGLCSLRPGVDRLVQSCLMEIDEHGTVVRVELHDGVIRSAARLTYTDVNAMLTDRDPAVLDKYAPLVPLVTRMRQGFDLLDARRRRRGAIDFDLPQAEVILDVAGLVEAIIPAERNVAHRMVEEFMLLANESVATYMADGDYPSLYRVHEAPDPFKVEEFQEFVAGLGFTFSPHADGVRPRDFQRLIEQVRGLPEERPVAFLMLRTMQLARYACENLGHFGLALATYTHFTSPIRRYPDLVVHRLLRHARRGELVGPRAEAEWETLEDVARQSSERERRAMEAERELLHWKQARFMVGKVGEDFDGIVTGVTPFGLFVELVDPFVEGLIHVSTLVDDDYRFDERSHQLRGAERGRAFRLGDRVRVQVARVDLDRRRIELALLDVIARVWREPQKPRRASSPRTRTMREKRGERETQRGHGRARTRRKR
jgi:ribonuclease R